MILLNDQASVWIYRQTSFAMTASRETRYHSMLSDFDAHHAVATTRGELHSTQTIVEERGFPLCS